MRPKRMISRNLLFTSKLCCFVKFHSSSLEFTTHFVPCVSHTFCIFERNCLTSFYFIWKSLIFSCLKGVKWHIVYRLLCQRNRPLLETPCILRTIRSTGFKQPHANEIVSNFGYIKQVLSKYKKDCHSDVLNMAYFEKK